LEWTDRSIIYQTDMVKFFKTNTAVASEGARKDTLFTRSQ
jgi:hypothetical protein